MTCQRENKIRCNEKLHIYTEYSINDIAHITYIGLTKETLKGMIINMKISELLNQEKATLSLRFSLLRKIQILRMWRGLHQTLLHCIPVI